MKMGGVMSMRLVRHLGIGIVAVLTGWAVPYPASAEIKLTDFNGTWSGSGKDRNLPLESLQQTKCKTTVEADLRRMKSKTVCDGQAGLHKEIDLSITLDGNRITGDLTQNTSVRGSDRSVRKGSVLGQKVEDTATYQVRFPGLVPIVATVDLRLLSQSSYSMHVTGCLGVTMMDVVFNKAARR
jgi:hypothetical protein